MATREISFDPNAAVISVGADNVAIVCAGETETRVTGAFVADFRKRAIAAAMMENPKIDLSSKEVTDFSEILK